MDDATEPTRKEIAAQGGIARSQSLTPERRSEIGSAGANARWGLDLPVATHEGELEIAGRRLSCHVLTTRKRVLSQQTFMQALGRSTRPKGGTGTRRLVGGEGGLPPFLSAANLEPYISDELRESTTPIIFRTKSGARGLGYDAMLLPLVCEAYLKLRDAHLKAVETLGADHGILQHMQVDVVAACDFLMRGLARVGIIALVDEATGFREQQTQDDLMKILEAYIAPELMPWTRRFEGEFFKQVYRIYGWPYKAGSTKRPQYVGKFINEYVYKQLPEGVLEELCRKNPVMESGYRRHKHTQLLADTGNEHLDRQITAVSTIMRISDDKDMFKHLFEKAYPRQQQLRLPLIVEVKPPDKEPTLFGLLDDPAPPK